MTRTMTETQYTNFCKDRRVSFGSKSAPNKFRDWLLFDSGNLFTEMKPNALAMEVLQYLAFETVAQIVDMCLLVKQGHRREPLDAVSALLTMKMKNPDYPTFQLKQQSQQLTSSTLSSSGHAESTLAEELIVASSASSSASEQQQQANKVKQSLLLSSSQISSSQQLSPKSRKRKIVSRKG